MSATHANFHRCVGVFLFFSYLVVNITRCILRRDYFKIVPSGIIFTVLIAKISKFIYHYNTDVCLSA